MKFKVTVIAILVAILGVTTTGVVMVVQEAREQTEIALKTAELVAIQADMQAYDQMATGASNYDEFSPDGSTGKNAYNCDIKIKEILNELGITGIRKDHTYTYEVVN